MDKSSIFSRIYPYKKKENKDSKENFLTEIFAYSLENDLIFLKGFLKYIEVDARPDTFFVTTQKSYPNLGRPDIEITDGKDFLILIECKIEASERENQLDDYCKILESQNHKNKILIYLTKYIEFKEIKSNKIKFIQMKWRDIFRLVPEQASPITQEMKQYLKDENMSENTNFSSFDLVALKTITDTIAKMDEVLEVIKPYFIERFGVFSKDSSRSTQLQYGGYYNISNIGNQNAIEIGFMWFDDEDCYLTTRVKLPKTEGNQDRISFFKKNLKDWDNYEVRNIIYYDKSRILLEFISENEEQIPDMVNFLKETIDNISKLKTKNPAMFGENLN